MGLRRLQWLAGLPPSPMDASNRKSPSSARVVGVPLARRIVFFTLATAVVVVLLTMPAIRLASGPIDLFAWLAVRAILLVLPSGIALASGASASDLGLVPRAGLGTEAPKATGGPNVGMRSSRVAWLSGAGLVLLSVGASRIPSVHAYYPVLPEARASVLWMLVSTGVFGAYSFATEAFFRGFLPHACAGIGPSSSSSWRGRWAEALLEVGIPVVPYVLVHAGKPALEIALSAPFGLLLGAVARRARSVWPGFLWHWGFATALNVACVVWPLSAAA